MVTKQGANSFFGVGRQTSLGVVAARTHFLDYNSEGIRYIPTYYNSPRLGSPSRRVHELVSRRSEGPITFEGNYEGGAFLALLKQALGVCNSSTVLGTARSHVITMTDVPPTPGLTVEIDKDGDSFLYEGCKVGSMRLTQEPSSIAMMEFTIAGRQESVAVPSTVSAGHFAWRQPMLPQQITATINSGSPLNMFRFELNIDNTLAADRRGLGSLDVREIVRGGQRLVSGSFELEFESLSDYEDIFKDEVDVPVTIDWTGEAISGGGGTNYSFGIDMPRVRMIGDTPQFSQHGPINFNVTFEAFESERRAQDEVTITVVNAQTSAI